MNGKKKFIIVFKNMAFRFTFFARNVKISSLEREKYHRSETQI